MLDQLTRPHRAASQHTKSLACLAGELRPAIPLERERWPDGTPARPLRAGPTAGAQGPQEMKI
jgi:hypothetical protein